MGFLKKIFGNSAGNAVSATAESIGNLAKDIRTAITGDIPPEKRADLYSKILDITSELAKLQSNVVIAEIQGQSWIQRAWRPVLMWVCIFIIAWNYIINPILGFNKAIDMPPELWKLLFIGVGGYITLRSGEKIINNLRK